MCAVRSGFLVVLMLVPSLGCSSQRVPTLGLDLSALFPATEDWYWKYGSEGFAEKSYWHHRGPSSPDGEEWTTFRVWVEQEQAIVDDVADGTPSDWSVELFFDDRPDGWYLTGWEANPEGPHAALGSELLSDGVPFAMTNVADGSSWTAEVSGRSWTTTAQRETETLSFNAWEFDESWRIEVVSDVQDTPLEGSWWLAGGRGLVQWDLSLAREDAKQPRPWELFVDQSYDAILGGE